MRAARTGTQLLDKTFSILRRISTRHHVGWSLSELSQACGYHHTTVHRILRFLDREGMVARRPGTRLYVLGPLAQEFGLAVHPAHDLRAPALEGLARLARRTGGGAFLNLRSGHDSVCAARIDGRLRIRALAIEPGTRRPLCLSAGGVAMLLRLPAKERAAALRYGLAEARRIGPQRLEQARGMVRRSTREGIGINADGIIPGITAIGVPVAARDGTPIAALSVASYSERFNEAALRDAVAALRREARLLEDALESSARASPSALEHV
ncbi:MAG: helix-turn-helix domain-containing protein [Burkholderiales bacterium]|nr:helix-turn-helix domain-containing protein [Burkholderiales bacterium]